MPDDQTSPKAKVPSIKLHADFKAQSEAQNDPHWKFSGGMTVQSIQPGLGDLVVKAMGGPDLPRDTFLIENMNVTFKDFAAKHPHSLDEQYLARIESMISQPDEFGYILSHEGEKQDGNLGIRHNGGRKVS
jgi:hypothetical protein